MENGFLLDRCDDFETASSLARYVAKALGGESIIVPVGDKFHVTCSEAVHAAFFSKPTSDADSEGWLAPQDETFINADGAEQRFDEAT